MHNMGIICYFFPWAQGTNGTFQARPNVDFHGENLGLAPSKSIQLHREIISSQSAPLPPRQHLTCPTRQYPFISQCELILALFPEHPPRRERSFPCSTTSSNARRLT